MAVVDGADMRGISSAIMLLAIVFAALVLAAFISVNIPNYMYCSNGEIAVPIEYCSKGIHSAESRWPTDEHGRLPDSWDSIEVTVVEAPTNFTDMVLNYLREHGYSVARGDVSGFTMLIKLIHNRFVPIDTRASLTLPNGSVITVTSARKLVRIPSGERIVIVGRNLSDFGGPIYAIKLVNGKPVAATRIRLVLINVSKSVELVKDIAKEIAAKLNLSIERVRELKIPTEVRRVVVVKRYALQAENPDVLRLGDYNLVNAIDPITYELHSQVTLFGVVYAEAVAKAEAWFVEGVGAVAVNDQSYCTSYYPPFMIVDSCDHNAYVTSSAGIHVYCYGKFVYTTIPPLFQITYCAGAKIVTDDVGREIAKDTRICYWPGYMYQDCRVVCPVFQNE